MASRYATDLTILTSSFGVQYYGTAMPKTIAVDPTDPVVTVDGGDRLDNLAFKYYGNAQYWWVLAIANNIVNGSLYPPQGTTLVIPDKSKFI